MNYTYINKMRYIPEAEYDTFNVPLVTGYNSMTSSNMFAGGAGYVPASVPVSAAGAKKRRSAAKIILFTSLFLCAIAAAITIFFFVKKDAQADEGTQTVRLTTVDDLEEKYGYEKLKEWDSDVNGIECIRCYGSGKANDGKSHSFVIFQSVHDAKKAFKYMRKTYFRDITFEEENHVEGWLAGICDAEEKDSIVLEGNVITFEVLDFYGYEEW